MLLKLHSIYLVSPQGLVWIEWLVFDTLIDCFSFCFFGPKIVVIFRWYLTVLLSVRLSTRAVSSYTLDKPLNEGVVWDNFFFVIAKNGTNLIYYLSDINLYLLSIIKHYRYPTCRYQNASTYTQNYPKLI